MSNATNKATKGLDNKLQKCIDKYLECKGKEELWGGRAKKAAVEFKELMTTLIAIHFPDFPKGAVEFTLSELAFEELNLFDETVTPQTPLVLQLPNTSWRKGEGLRVAVSRVDKQPFDERTKVYAIHLEPKYLKCKLLVLEDVKEVIEGVIETAENV